MGMGDVKRPFTPVHEKVLDNVLNKVFAKCCVRECPHPSVIRQYGVGGVAMVSVWTCKKCKHVIKEKMYGGYTCGYQLEPAIQAVKNGESG